MGFKGVAFPFRLSNKGGVLLTDTTAENPDHLTENLEQLVGTRRYERVMEVGFCCPLETSVFEENESAKTMIIRDIVNAVEEHLDDRIAISESDIDVSFGEGGDITAMVTYDILSLGVQETVPVVIGGN